jgi:predicted component of type VI protein secretion system
VPWILICANGEELERRELTAAVVIGRSPECDIAIRDILLSRTHCRIEPLGQGWRLVDLDSKNGTHVGWQAIKTHDLRDGDHLRMGRTRIVYFTSPFEPPAHPTVPRTDRIVRPADPHEALTGTVTDFVLLDDQPPPEDPAPLFANHPVPQPRPMDPVETAAVESPSDDLASSFWYREGDATATAIAIATATTTTIAVAPQRSIVRALPRIPALARPVYRELRLATTTSSETDLSLQVDERHLLLDVTQAAAALPRRQSRARRAMTAAAFALAAAIGTGIVVMSLWLLTLAPR